MKPANISYGVDDRPPAFLVILTAIQHTAFGAGMGIVFPLLVLQAAGATQEATGRAVALSMVALGVATMLQALRRPYLGSGFLAPAVFAAAYLPASLDAARMGGMALVAGMTIFAGAVEIALGCFITRLRPFLPTEIAGFAVLMIGIVNGMLGFNLMIIHPLQAAGGQWHAAYPALALGLASVALMVALNVWGHGKFKAYSVLIGIVFGYAAGAALGVLAPERFLATIAQPPQIPVPPESLPAFLPALAVPFAVGALASLLRAVGDLTICQKINDSNWTRPHFRSIRGGVFADGLGTLIAGALGTVGLSTFSGSIALSAVTGVTARIVGFVIGATFIVMAIIPSIRDLLAAMPEPLMGAILLFSGTFVFINGMQVVMSRLLDSRKVFVIGVSLVVGLSHDVYTSFYESLPGAVAPLVSSSLIMALICALVLNAIFRLGIKRKVSFAYDPKAQSVDDVIRSFEEQGGAWGARRDVVQRVEAAFVEFSEHVGDIVAPGTTMTVTMSFDETSIVIEIAYEGQILHLSRHAPDAEKVLEDEDALADLSGFLIARLADNARTATRGRLQILRLDFHH